MRIFISTGEVSGDLQGAMLVDALYQQAARLSIDLEIIALGGQKMADKGAQLIYDTSGIGSVGILESLPLILPTWQVQRRAKAYLQAHPPDLVILIDYLGPNLAIGSYLRQTMPQIPIVYYIAPQAWVWAPQTTNIKQLVSITDYLLAIFPAEAEFYRQLGVKVDWVGHPLLDKLPCPLEQKRAREILGVEADKTVITLLPASRQQELKYILPVMFTAAQSLQQHLLRQVEFLIPLSLPQYRDKINQGITDYQLQARVVEGNPYQAIAAADLAITKSGTVNLEIALLNVPQVVVYRVHPLTIWLARHLLKFSIPYMSPPNLVMNREIVPELLQEKANSTTIVAESLAILQNSAKISQIKAEYQAMRQKLGEEGVCQRAARAILQWQQEAMAKC